MLEEILRWKGHEVSVAEDGAAGLALFSANKPQLVIVDRSLPQAARSDVLKAIRKLDKKVKVILFTAFTTQSKSKYAGLGVDAFLSKGASLDALLQAINGALSG